MTFKQDVQIDPTAIVLPNVELGPRTIVEPFCLIGLQDRFHPDLITKIGKDSFLFYLKSLGKVLKPESFKFFYLIIKILNLSQL